MDTEANGSMTWAHSNVWTAGTLLATYDWNGLHFYLNDPLGSRRVQTDSLGVVEQSCTSLPYGDGESCGTTPTEHLFTGKERDTESGNDYFGARYYASSMGRFMSPDPLLNSGRPGNPQTWNRYTYGLNNPLRNTDPTGLYTCSGDKSQCSGVSDALKAAKGALGNLKKGSAEYNALSSAISSYGKAGVDNGVHVGFGATSGAASTTVGVMADANGNKVTTADNPTGQNINVTVDPSKNGSTNQEAINLAHEGSHVADGSALVGALPMNLSGSDAVLGGPLNMTSYQTEMKAYGVSSYAAQGLGLGSLSVGNGNVIWNSSWGAVDAQTLRTQGIQHELADPKGLYNVTPDSQGHKLIQ
jgi:RHS repeat-associated protein